MKELSPIALARTAGALYLTNIVLGAFAIGVVPALVAVAGDAAATARNIHSYDVLYRLGIVAHVIVLLTNVPLAVIFYELFRVVSRGLALLAAFFTLAGTAVEASGLTSQFAPIALLSGSTYSSALTPSQIQALAYMPLDLQAVGYAINSIFFGFYGLTVGYLVFRSNFLPRVIGVLLAIGAASYLTYAFVLLISPSIAGHLVPYIQLPSLVGEGSFALWLLIAGINGQRWSSLLSAAHASP